MKTMIIAGGSGFPGTAHAAKGCEIGIGRGTWQWQTKSKLDSHR